MTVLRDLVVDRINRDQIEIRWESDGHPGIVSIYEDAIPDDIDTETAVAWTTRESVVLLRPSEIGRSYFRVAPEGDQGRIVAERLVPFEQISNLRDLGGYETSSGRTVRWGKVFRSGDLSLGSESDLAQLTLLGLRTVIDLRGPDIVAERPDRLPDSHTRLVELAMEGRGFPAMAARVSSGEVTDPEQVRAFRVQQYSTGLSRDRPTIALVVEMLLDPSNLPLVFHCRAGKDRTGAVSALLLSLLGVPQETVMEDYLLTNRYRADLLEQRTAGHPYPDTLRALMLAREEYLRAFLDSIHSQYGSIERYAQDALGMTSSMIERLQDVLLNG